jgi:hypothetical protein
VYATNWDGCGIDIAPIPMRAGIDASDEDADGG